MKRSYKHHNKLEVPYGLLSYKERVGQIKNEPLCKKATKELGSLAYYKSMPKCKNIKTTVLAMELDLEIIMKAYKKRCSNEHKKEAMKQTYNAYAAGFIDALNIFKLLKDENGNETD